MSFPHSKIEKKWQEKWRTAQAFKAEIQTDRPKYYALDMFPYPSGAGLHVGHLASYTPTDIIARYKRCRGFNVLHPFGYDAFGLPAEQFAIQTGEHPAAITGRAIENFRRQLMMFGFSFDWDREVSTCDPDFYKWTQKIFLLLFEKGLVYQKDVLVNWCPALRTVLANEEVVDGKSERGGHPVLRVPMKQWMLRITAYAERLLNDLDLVDWPEATKEGQRNWIGRSVGARVDFTVAGTAEILSVFTTRPDTLFGVTFMVLAPEHPLVPSLTVEAQRSVVEAYVAQTKRRSDLERKTASEKTGIFTGAYALHPITGAKLPLWISDYVLMDYGTGAIMAVPAHDTRDFEFAEKFGLPVRRVLETPQALPDEGDGLLIDSDFLNGMDKNQAIETMIARLETNGHGRREVQYKLRDWLFSRQRYWGEPFPLVAFPGGEVRGVPENELPVRLPEVANYEPTEQGEPPLARVPEFLNYTDSVTGERGQRITDTMPGSAGSSWYFLRYTDPHNVAEPFSYAAQAYWMPVDLYIGGTEHTVGHLLYSRFWHKVLFDAGLVSTPEPFLRLAHQGVVMGPDGQRMSKSRGNVINPDDVRELYGADAVRTYINFMGPFDKDKLWDTNGIEGVRRFLDRLWRFCFDQEGQLLFDPQTEPEIPEELRRTYHKTIKKVTEDLDQMSFNTAISAMMILVNELYRHQVRSAPLLRGLSQLLMPFAPHLAEEIWERLGGTGLVSLAPWPHFDPTLVVEDFCTLGVQVNGKMRGTIQVGLSASEAEAVALALGLTTVQKALDGQTPKKVIYKAGKILNLIAGKS